MHVEGLRPVDSDVTELLHTEHAVARVLAAAPGEAEAYPELLAAMGEALAWDFGAVWVPVVDDALRCVATWPQGAQFAAESQALTLAAGQGLPGRVWAAGAPAWLTDVPPDTTLPRAEAAARAGLLTAFGFPVRGAAGILGVIEFFTSTRRAADEALLATMGSLGLQIGQFVERCRAQEAVREADARKSAILNAAFDCVVTMDHRGHIVEVNKATERTFGYSAEEMIGQELAALMIPPRSAGRAPQGADPLHRHRPVADDQPPGRAARDARGRLRVPGRARDHAPRAPGPPLFCGYMRDVTERRTRRGGAAAAGRRAGRAAAGRDRGRGDDATRRTCSALVTEEVGPAARCADARTWSASTSNGSAAVVGGWNAAGVEQRPGRRLRQARRRHRRGARVAHGRARARGQLRRHGRARWPRRCASLGFRCAVAAPM